MSVNARSGKRVHSTNAKQLGVRRFDALQRLDCLLVMAG
jgi:hypothetical protein